MTRDNRRVPDLTITPESAVWLLYAGLVQGGLRWRRHLATSPRPSATYAPQRLVGLARR